MSKKNVLFVVKEEFINMEKGGGNVLNVGRHFGLRMESISNSFKVQRNG